MRTTLYKIRLRNAIGSAQRKHLQVVTVKRNTVYTERCGNPQSSVRILHNALNACVGQSICTCKADNAVALNEQQTVLRTNPQFSCSVTMHTVVLFRILRHWFQNVHRCQLVFRNIQNKSTVLSEHTDLVALRHPACRNHCTIVVQLRYLRIERFKPPLFRIQIAESMDFGTHEHPSVFERQSKTHERRFKTTGIVRTVVVKHSFRMVITVNTLLCAYPHSPCTVRCHVSTLDQSRGNRFCQPMRCAVVDINSVRSCKNHFGVVERCHTPYSVVFHRYNHARHRT